MITEKKKPTEGGASLSVFQLSTDHLKDVRRDTKLRISEAYAVIKIEKWISVTWTHVRIHKDSTSLGSEIFYRMLLY